MTLVTPWAALACLAGVVPLAVAVARGRRARRLCRELGLVEPRPVARLGRPAALVCLFALLGLAAAQPSLRHETARTARTDAELLVVLDGSRSMLAASSAKDTPRYRRAAAFARRLRHALPDLPTGAVSLTNRVLPYLFPTADLRIFDGVVDEAYGIQHPAPAIDVQQRVTTFDPLAELAERHFFSPSVRKRVAVVLSDLETNPFDEAVVLQRLQASGATPILVRFWRSDERVFRRNGSLESYRPSMPSELRELRAAGWPAYPETSLDEVVARVRRAIGSGPMGAFGLQRQDRPIAPILALAALAPLLLLIAPAGRLPLPRRRATGETATRRRRTYAQPLPPHRGTRRTPASRSSRRGSVPTASR